MAFSSLLVSVAEFSAFSYPPPTPSAREGDFWYATLAREGDLSAVSSPLARDFWFAFLAFLYAFFYQLDFAFV